MEYNISEFEKLISYTFNDKTLLINAFVHSSFANEHKQFKSNERLEFLGDKVLDIIVSTNIFKNFPDYDEGKMSKLRAEIVREESLAVFARKINIHKFIKLGRSEVLVHGEFKDSILSDCFEAVAGAIYLDSNFSTAEHWVNSIIKPETYHSFVNKQSDSKSTLQELVKKEGGEITYKLINETGPEHEKVFEIAVLINGKIFSKGKAGSKKKAEQNAALKALKKMRD